MYQLRRGSNSQCTTHKRAVQEPTAQHCGPAPPLRSGRHHFGALPTVGVQGALTVLRHLDTIARPAAPVQRPRVGLQQALVEGARLERGTKYCWRPLLRLQQMLQHGVG